MTLPKMPLKEWLSSSSSPQNVDQRDGKCRLLLSLPLSSRNRLPKSPPSSGLKNGEEWLQEARALPLENAPSILIKPFSGRHAALHAGGIRVSIRVGIRVVMVQRFGARCHSVCYINCYSNCYSEMLQYSCGHLCARMVTRMKSRTWPFLHVSVLQYWLQFATVPPDPKTPSLVSISSCIA